MSKWMKVRVADIAVPKGLVGGPFGSSLGTKDYAPFGVPVIRGINLSSDGRFDGREFVYVTSEKADRDLSRNLAKPGDVVFTQRGTLGQVGLVPPSPFEKYVISQSQMRLRINPELALPEFIYYQFKSPNMVAAIHNHAITTGVPHINLGILRDLEVVIPSLDNQRRICTLLGALDDKIAINDHIATNSQDLAIALGHRLISRYGGEKTLLKEHSEIVKGVSYRSADLVEGGGSLATLKCVGRNSTFQMDGLKPFIGECKPAQVLQNGDIIVAQTDLTQRAEVIGRPVRVPNSPREERWVASLDLAIVRPIGSLTQEVLFALVATKDFHNHALSYCNGTTVLHMGKKALPEYQFRMPDITHTEKISIQMRSLFDRSDHARNENLVLVELRDALLPKLISGEIRIRDAEKVVEDAA